MVILDQNRAVLVASVICFQKIFGLHGLNHQIIEYLVSRGRYWLVLDVTGSEQGGTGCQHDELLENCMVSYGLCGTFRSQEQEHDHFLSKKFWPG